jgi:hypothetical protein
MIGTNLSVSQLFNPLQFLSVWRTGWLDQVRMICNQRLVRTFIQTTNCLVIQKDINVSPWNISVNEADLTRKSLNK